jgi:DNA-binding CsgD family transcriptional regulator
MKFLPAARTEILNLIVQGLTNAQIADRLFISFETVRSHRKNISVKTRCKNTASLINYYYSALYEI